MTMLIEGLYGHGAAVGLIYERGHKPHAQAVDQLDSRLCLSGGRLVG